MLLRESSTRGLFLLISTDEGVSSPFTLFLESLLRDDAGVECPLLLLFGVFKEAGGDDEEEGFFVLSDGEDEVLPAFGVFR